MMKYQSEKQASRIRLLSESEILDTSHGLVEVAQIGKGPPVLISHGGGGGYDMGVWLAGLIGRGFHFIAPSRFGYLRSPMRDIPTPEHQADAFASLLDALKIESAAIIGLSSGGPAALQFSYRHPKRCDGLVMLSAISRSMPPLPMILRMIYPFILKSDFLPWLIYALNSDFVHRSNGVNREILVRVKNNPVQKQLLDDLFQTTFPASLRREGMINDQQQCAFLPDDFLENIRVPTLVIHAVDDPIVPFQQGEFSAENIPGAVISKIEEGGHFCAVTQREDIVLKIKDFLDRFGS